MRGGTLKDYINAGDKLKGLGPLYLSNQMRYTLTQGAKSKDYQKKGQSLKRTNF